MSNYLAARSAQTPAPDLKTLFHQAESELAEGYIEIEMEGLTPRRLLCIYAAVAQAAWHRAINNMRSLFPFHPAH